MSIINNGLLLASEAAAAGGYQVSRSLRFNSSDSAYLSWTPASAGNRKTWTWAGWVKRSALSTNQRFFGMFQGGVAQEYFRFESNDTLKIAVIAESKGFTTTQVFRDASAWYHIVVALDTPQATDSNRLKLYVNGTQVTTFSSATYPVQDSTGEINNTYPHFISNGGGSEYFNGYLADIHFIDGQALTPSSFAETDATTGQWIPKLYTGSYGTNGFRLPFSDNSGTTSTTLGKDSAGSNNWTPNNFSVAAGAGNDSLVDTPTSYGTDAQNGGEVRGNYCTLNPLDNGGTTLSNGNLDVTKAGAGFLSVRGTIGMSSGKWYWEYTRASGSGNNLVVGLAGASANITTYFDISANGYGYRANDGNKTNNNTASSYGDSYAAGDVVGIAFDADAGSLTFYKNGTSQGTAFTSLTSGPYFPAVAIAGGDTGSLNFGQRPFAYPVSGFKALCDTNLTAPVIAKPSEVMDILLWSGNNASPRSLSGLNFSPDFAWLKVRSDAAGHSLFDTVRGTGKTLETNVTSAEVTNSQFGYISAFDSAGFTVTAGTYPGFESGSVNMTGRTYVGWCWDAGSSTVTNTQGSITSSVRANASAGFSVVTWTSDGASSVQTMGTGLGVAPGLIIAKNRSISGNWWVWHSSFSNQVRDYLLLQTTDAKVTAGVDVWSTSSTTFGIRQATIANSTNSCVAYCFAPVTGYSSFGSYTGNGSADGPFVYTGFRPRWVMIKVTNISGESWVIKDSARGTFNPNDPNLYADLSIAEQTGSTARYIDFTSNGFKLRGTEVSVNGSGNTYVYMCFAESPFAYARAR